MPTIFCPESLSCPSTRGLEDDWPVQNWSSEDPDQEIFIGLSWGWDWNWPPLGSRWTRWNCFAVCESTISQEDADFCAARLSLLCAQDPNVEPNPTRFPAIYFNSRTPCITRCPDGLEFTHTVEAGKFAATSQVMANRMAHSYACQVSRRLRVCLSDLSPAECCIDEPYNATITATGLTVVSFGNIWRIMSGMLPHGLELNDGGLIGGPSVTIEGTPDEAGAFTFQIQVMTPTGEFMQKEYTICVVEIMPDSLPGATIGTAYSQTVQASTCAEEPLSWQVFSGALPPGLTLDEETGVISGTPTALGNYDFTILLQTEAT